MGLVDILVHVICGSNCFMPGLVPVYASSVHFLNLKSNLGKAVESGFLILPLNLSS